MQRLTDLDGIRKPIEQQLNSNTNTCTGTEQGRWLIRCNSCADLFSCNVSSQIWLPYDCTYRTFDQQDLRKCFMNKNVSIAIHYIVDP